MGDPTEILHGIPFILVGTKLYLREDENMSSAFAERGESLVTKEEGESLATEIDAVKYMEISSLTNQGVK